MARYKFDKEFESHFIKICSHAQSMSKTAFVLNMNYKTLCFYAKRLICFKSNQSSKKMKKHPAEKAVSLQEIFDVLHQTHLS